MSKNLFGPHPVFTHDECQTKFEQRTEALLVASRRNKELETRVADLTVALKELGAEVYTAFGCAMNPRLERAMARAMTAIKFGEKA